MTLGGVPIAAIVFVFTIVIAFGFAFYGRNREQKELPAAVSGQRLNRWLVGLSAGAAANSGFVVTGAVGLGYTAGLHWVMLPLAWLVGDLIYWAFFPKRVNALAQKISANTVGDLIAANAFGATSKMIRPLISIVVLGCLGVYTSAQWLAGEKFVTGAFQLSPTFALIVFAAIIVSYTAIGGFRGSVYTDSYQAILRIIGTTLALVMLVAVALRNPSEVMAEIAKAGPSFLQFFPTSSVFAALAFMAGYAAAALGFGLGQPQILTRYMSASSPSEAQAAKWIYIAFVQYTWIVMTLFGVLLRGVQPNLEDGETGLAAFFAEFMPPALTGLIIADIFATIAATSNSLIVAMAQTLRFGWSDHEHKASRAGLFLPACIVGLATMALSLVIHGSVVTLALSSVSIMGAGLAPAVMVRVLHWPHTSPSLLLSILAGTATSIAWKVVRFDATLNEALPGIAIGLAINFLVVILSPKRGGV